MRLVVNTTNEGGDGVTCREPFGVQREARRLLWARASITVSLERSHRDFTVRNSLTVRIRFDLGMSFTMFARVLRAAARVNSVLVSPASSAH